MGVRKVIPKSVKLILVLLNSNDGGHFKMPGTHVPGTLYLSSTLCT